MNYLIIGDTISLKSEIDDFLKDYEKLIIIGIGNELRGDDGLGSFIIKELEKEETINNDKIIIIDGGSAPENFTGLIKKENPSHIIIVDAALMGSEVGTIKSIKKEEIDNINLSSHSMSLSFLIKYLENDIEFKFLFIGIEPLAMNLGEGLSKEILKSANSLKNTFISSLNEI